MRTHAGLLNQSALVKYGKQTHRDLADERTGPTNLVRLSLLKGLSLQRCVETQGRGNAAPLRRDVAGNLNGAGSRWTTGGPPLRGNNIFYRTSGKIWPFRTRRIAAQKFVALLVSVNGELISWTAQHEYLQFIKREGDYLPV